MSENEMNTEVKVGDVVVQMLPPDPLLDQTPKDLDVNKAIADFCIEMSGSFLQTEAQRDFRKAAVERLNEITGVSKSVLSYCARTYHNQDFEDKVERTDEMQTFYEKIFGIAETKDDSNDD